MKTTTTTEIEKNMRRIDRRLARIEHDIHTILRTREEDQDWIGASEVAEVLAITIRQLAPDRLPPGFPSPSRIRRRRMWRRAEIELWRASGGGAK